MKTWHLAPPGYGHLQGGRLVRLDITMSPPAPPSQTEVEKEEEGEEGRQEGLAGAVPALRRPGAGCALPHGLQQPVDKVGGRGVGALHQAALHTLHDGITLPGQGARVINQNFMEILGERKGPAAVS